MSFISSVYPSYNNVTNYSGEHAAIKSAGTVHNGEQAQSLSALERAGHLSLTQFGLLRLPREVLFLQEERNAKVKTTKEGDEVASSNKSDLDEGRDLNKVDNNTGARRSPVDAAATKAKADHLAAAENRNAALADEASALETQAAQKQQADKTDGAHREFAPAQHRAEEAAGSAFAAENKAEAAKTERKNEKGGKPERPSLIGLPTTAYATLQATTQPPAAPDAGADYQPLNVLA